MTPGPWRINRGGAIVADADPTGTAIELPDESSYDAAFLIADAVNVGNRAVIAAAPELLATCRHLLDVLGTYTADMGLTTAEERRTVAIARSVIARAEGRIP